MEESSILKLVKANYFPVDGSATYPGTFAKIYQESLTAKMVYNRAAKGWCKAQCVIAAKGDKDVSLEECIAGWRSVSTYENQILLLEEEAGKWALYDHSGERISDEKELTAELMHQETIKQEYLYFLDTTLALKVRNYSDFKRINEILKRVGQDDTLTVYSITSPDEWDYYCNLLFTDSNFKLINETGHKQYENAVKTYGRFLRTRQYFSQVPVEKTNLKIHDLSLQQIYFGAPGTGKSHEINEACKAYENYRTTFHPDTDYAGFVGAYKPINKPRPIYDSAGHKIMEGGEEVLQPRIEYRYVFQAFLKAYIAAWKEQQNDEPKPVFLVIEEINRGNCAQIFGDIFQLLDRNASGFSDYPIVADDDLAKELKEVLGSLNIVKKDDINKLYDNGKDVVKSVLNGEQLLLPNNLYIWATMNTSDQSLFPIDSAFKRRWDWKYVKIKDHSDQAYKIQFKNGKEYDWWEFIEAINSKIEGGEIQQEDKKLGYFFAKAKEDADGNKLISAETFLSKVIFYLYNDVFKDFGFDEAFFKDENGQVMTFASYFDDEGRPNEARVESFVRNVTNADEKEKIAAEETSTDQPEQEEADTAADENPD